MKLMPHLFNHSLKLNHSLKQRGIILILTLFMLLILSLALSNVFEDSLLELKMLDNDQKKFYVDTITRSIFRALLIKILEEGTNEIYKFIPYLQNFQIPEIEEVDVVILYSKLYSMDHFLNLNQDFFIEENEDENKVTELDFINAENRTQILTNILKQRIILPPEEDPNDFSFLNGSIGAIQDWIDTNDVTLSENDFEGAEQEYYTDLNPEYFVKNNSLDVLSELNAVLRFGNLNLKTDQKLPFTLYESNLQKNCLTGPLNVNMSNNDTIESYISFFEDLQEPPHSSPNDTSKPNQNLVCPYSELIESKEDIKNFLKKRSGDIFAESYSIPLNKDTNWKNDLENTRLTVEDAAYLFSSRSNYIGIEFTVEIGTVQRTINAHLKLEYASESEKNPNKIKIIYFKLY